MRSGLRLGLTRRQSDLLEFIKAFTTKHKYSPSFSEMAEGVGVRSKNAVYQLVTALVERGHITKAKDKMSRSIVIRNRP